MQKRNVKFPINAGGICRNLLGTDDIVNTLMHNILTT